MSISIIDRLKDNFPAVFEKRKTTLPCKLVFGIYTPFFIILIYMYV